MEAAGRCGTVEYPQSWKMVAGKGGVLMFFAIMLLLPRGSCLPDSTSLG